MVAVGIVRVEVLVGTLRGEFQTGMVAVGTVRVEVLVGAMGGKFQRCVNCNI